MARKTTITALAACLMTVLAATSCGIKPSGTVITEERTVGNFTAIHVRDGIDAFVSLDTAANISVRADDNIADYILTAVTDSTLHVGLAEGCRLGKGSTANVRITVPTLSDLSASGYASLTLEGLMSGNYLGIRLDDHARLSGAIYVLASDISLKRSSNANIEGECHAANISCDGRSTLRGYGFSVDNAGISLSGKSKIELDINDKVMVQSDGKSSLKYTGDAKIIRLDNDDVRTPEEFIISIIDK